MEPSSLLLWCQAAPLYLDGVGDGLFPSICYFMELLQLAVNNIVARITYTFVDATTTIGGVPVVPVDEVDEVVAPIPLHLVRIALPPWGLISAVKTGKNIVVTTVARDLVVPLTLDEGFAVVGTLDVGRISHDGE